MVTITEEQWQKLREFGKQISPVPEQLDRKMTRVLMKDPESIPLLFEAIRRDVKENIKTLDEMESKVPYLKGSEDLKYTFKLILFFARKEQEAEIDQWNYIESLAFNQIELRKDIARLIKSTKKTKENNKIVTHLQNKVKQQKIELQEFRKTKPYLEFTKRFWDEKFAEETQN